MIFKNFVILSAIMLIFSTVFLLAVVPNAYALSIVAVTDNGSTFPITFGNSDDSSSSSNSNGTRSASFNATSVLNGFGINSLIYTTSELGEVIWGTGITGTSESLTPYTLTNSSANFASVILDTDTKDTYPIPEFWKEYSFGNSTLTDITQIPPNVLGYIQSRTTIGSVIITNSDGITVTGTGEVIMELNNYQGQSLILRGDTGAGAIKIITSATDLMNAVFTPGKGYQTHAGGNPGINGISIVSGTDSTHTGEYDYSYWVDAYLHRHPCKCSDHYHPGYTAYAYDATSTLVKVDNTNHKLITGHTNTGSISNFRLWDTLPSIEKISFSGGIYETNFQFPNEQSYLFVNPNGGTVTIKGETSVNIPILKIINLPANTPYEISKDGWIGVSGVTSDTGIITLYDDDLRFEGFTTQGGLLHLYPNSMSYSGSYTTICFDTENIQIFHIVSGEDQVCVPSAFVKLPISMDVEINEISSGTITFDYLSGNYTAGDFVSAPIIPEMKTISFTLNGIDAQINIADITNTAQTKILSYATDTVTNYSTENAIESIEVSVINSAIMIAPNTGTMNVNISVTPSAAATFSINSDYTDSYDAPMVACSKNQRDADYCQPRYNSDINKIVYQAVIDSQAAYDGELAAHKQALKDAITAQGALTILVDIYNNGAYVDTVEIYRDLTPTFTASSDLGLISVQNASVVYSQSTGSQVLSIDVEAGDYIQFVVTAGLTVTGIPTPVNSDDNTIAGFASGTVTLHSGSITATMG